MRKTISRGPLVLQPPADFRTARADGVLTLSDGELMAPDSRGLYRLDNAHVHLLASFVAQGWHAPRPDMPISRLELCDNKQILNTDEILELAHSEHVALKVEFGRLLMRGAPSGRLRAHLRSAGSALRDALAVRERSIWVEV